MSGRFVDVDRDTAYLLPPSVQAWLPEDHLARFVVEIVEGLELGPLTRAYGGRGSDAFPPAMMVALLFYGYATGVFASRQLERATYDSVAMRYVAANRHPDHDTIAHFRKRFLPELSALFVQILAVAHQMGMVKLGTVSLDGTKVQANASKHRALSWEHAGTIEAQLRAEVEQLMQLAAQADAAAIPDGMCVPDELKRREARLAAIAGRRPRSKRARPSGTRRSRRRTQRRWRRARRRSSRPVASRAGIRRRRRRRPGRGRRIR